MRIMSIGLLVHICAEICKSSSTLAAPNVTDMFLDVENIYNMLYNDRYDIPWCIVS